MKIHKVTLPTPDVPENLRNISSPPRELHVLSSVDINVLLLRPCITVVGSRKASAYGKLVTTQVTEELARSGLVIISGLAIGVDTLAHKSALDAGGTTIAVLPCGLDQIYPACNRALARRILEQGGALITEYPEGSPVYKHHFIARNRLESAMSKAVLVTEAAEKSGTLHTATFALEQGKAVLAVPGNVTSPTSAGTNNLIKSGATPVTCADDVLFALGLPQKGQSTKRPPHGNTPEEQIILNLLFDGTADGDELLRSSSLSASSFNQSLTMLEIRGVIRPLGSNQWRLT